MNIWIKRHISFSCPHQRGVSLHFSLHKEEERGWIGEEAMAPFYEVIHSSALSHFGTLLPYFGAPLLHFCPTLVHFASLWSVQICPTLVHFSPLGCTLPRFGQCKFAPLWCTFAPFGALFSTWVHFTPLWCSISPLWYTYSFLSCTFSDLLELLLAAILNHWKIRLTRPLYYYFPLFKTEENCKIQGVFLEFQALCKSCQFYC